MTFIDLLIKNDQNWSIFIERRSKSDWNCNWRYDFVVGFWIQSAMIQFIGLHHPSLLDTVTWFFFIAVSQCFSTRVPENSRGSMIFFYNWFLVNIYIYILLTNWLKWLVFKNKFWLNAFLNVPWNFLKFFLSSLWGFPNAIFEMKLQRENKSILNLFGM